MKPAPIAIFVLLPAAAFLVEPSYGASILNRLKADLKKVQVSREAELKEIQSEAKQRDAAIAANAKALNDANASKAELKRLADQNAEDLKRISAERNALAREAANLKYDKQERDLQIQELENQNEKLENQRDALENQMDRLENHKILLVGSTIGFLLTTGLAFFATKRTWRSAKLEDKVSELEIIKLERELGVSSSGKNQS